MMPEKVSVGDLKRIEGHGRVSVVLDDDGAVADAHFEALEFRGFERILLDRMIWEMPRMTSRICGICPVSHHVASVKATERLLGVEIPETATLLRELLQLASFVHDHALHFFFLAGPDFLTEEEPASRGLLGVVAAHPELAKAAIRIRRVGQDVVAAVGGQAGHPVTAIPGGMSRSLAADVREELLSGLESIEDDLIAAERLARESSLRLVAEHPSLAEDDAVYMALTSKDGRLSVYEGDITVGEADGTVLERIDADEYSERLPEEVVGHSYAKAPAFRGDEGRPRTVRVGPLARVLLSPAMTGERTAAMRGAMLDELGEDVRNPLAYHWARMIELVAVVDRMREILADDRSASRETRVKVERVAGEGTAAVEAPRGTLLHHYAADAVGRVTEADLVVATTFNNRAIDETVARAARSEVTGGELTPEANARIEMAVRAYDPCLSCATHEVGRMPLAVELIGPDGTLLGRQGVSG